MEIRAVPKYPRLGERVEVVASDPDPLSHVKLVCTQPDGTVLGRTPLELGKDGEFHTWSWTLEPVVQRGVHILKVTAGEEGEWEGWFRVPWGSPRVQYARVYVLLPPDATMDEAQRVMEEHLSQRHTVGWSADDAGVGDLEEKRAIIVDPHRWKDDILAFFDEYYPEVEVGAEYTVNPWLVCQRDGRWKDRGFGEGCVTIGSAGCFITCLAMVLRFYGLDKNATPVTVDSALGLDGYGYDEKAGCRCLAEWEDVNSDLGLSIRKVTDNAVVDAWLGKGRCAMAEVRLGGHQHFVLVTGRDRKGYRCLDPWYCLECHVGDFYATVVSWRLLEPISPPPPVVTPTDNVLVTGHVQGSLEALAAYLRTAKPRGVKLIAWGIRDVFNWHPGIELIVLRKWYGNSPDNGYFLNHPDPMRAAAEYCDIVLPGVREEAQWLYDRGWRGRLAIESLNEAYCTHCTDNVKAREFDISFCTELMDRDIPLVVPAVFTAAVGNPHEEEAREIVLPVARTCERYNGVMCYHSYWGVDCGKSGLESHWEWHAGRAEEFDKVLREDGIEVDWFFSEAGATYGPAPGYAPTPVDGWRATKCFDGDWRAYRNELMRYNWLLNQRFGERCYGAALFTTGGGGTWKYFEMGRAEWDDLAFHV